MSLRSADQVRRQAAAVALELEEASERLRGMAESRERARRLFEVTTKLEATAAQLDTMASELNAKLHDIDSEAFVTHRRPPALAWALQERLVQAGSALKDSVRALWSHDPPLVREAASIAEAARTLHATAHLSEDALLVRWIEDRVQAADLTSLAEVLGAFGDEALAAAACSVGRHLHRVSGCSVAYPVPSASDRFRLLLEALLPCDIQVRIGPRDGRTDPPKADPDGAAEIQAYLRRFVPDSDLSVEVHL